ncbi:MAG TPA: ion channel [Stellaceae bacterium]|jgi:inward rectifier potassium channel|nr:ion channel [Stellaceae bacterium]
MPDGRVTPERGKPRKSVVPARRRRHSTPPLSHEPPDGVEASLAHLIAHGRADEVISVGLERPWFDDIYHRVLKMGWPSFFALGASSYLVANLLFAVLYLLQPGAITNAHAGSFLDAFFFSVQTMATIGYGVMSPATVYANLLMTLETAVGLMFVALTTGLVFARFSRPTARIMFSQVAVVGPYNSKPALTVRLANQRQNQLLAAHVSMTLVRDELTEEGSLLRRFYDLKLVRDRSPIFALTFTAIHEIDAQSPLHGASAERMASVNAELVVSASGVDETLVQPVQARASYLPHEILWNHRFADIIGWTEDGRRAIDYGRFHDTVSVTPSA